MGRLIDTSDLHNKVMLNKSDWGIFATQIDNLIEEVVMQVSTAEAIPKDQYEARLKADMVAMLEELHTEIEEKKFLESSCSLMDKTEEKNYAVYTDDISKVIQQKIDAIKKVVEDGKV